MKTHFCVLLVALNLVWSGYLLKTSYDRKEAAMIAAKYGWLAALEQTVPRETLPLPALCLDLRNIDHRAQLNKVYDRTQIEPNIRELRQACGR